MYRLPERLRDAVDAQYRRDVARVHGEEAAAGGRFDDEYKSFIQVLCWCCVCCVGMGRCGVGGAEGRVGLCGWCFVD